MIYYDENLKIKDALEIYFSKYHFKDGGYHLKWFRIKLGMFYIPVPNIPSRVRAVKLHDIHHIVTGYEANYRGEAEIGGWEIASGCGIYYVAWILNFGSFLIGILFYPRALFNAFMRGRRCGTNLYYGSEYDDRLLDKTVGELRNEIDIDRISKKSFSDYPLFFLCAVVAFLPYIILVSLILFIFQY